MQRILNFINDLSMDDKTERIINGEIDERLLEQKSHQLSLLPTHEQISYMAKLKDRIKQITKPHKLLSVLLLINILLQQNDKLKLPQLQFCSMKDKISKEYVILFNIAKYYHYFLQANNSNMYNKYTLNAQEELNEAEHFCQLAILKITEFFKIDFLFINGYGKLQKHKELLRLILISILLRFRVDLDILTTFVKNNLEIVLQKTVDHPLIFRINHTYQKLLFINRSMEKLEKMARLVKQKIEFPKYEIDLERNKEIQMTMLERQQEKKQFYKNWKNRVPEEYQNCYLEVSSAQTTESFLLIGDSDDQV